MSKSPSDKDAIRKIWLAGIGAYGRAFSEAKGAVDSLAGKGSEVFDELVQKGEMLEAVGKYKASELMGKGKAAVEDIKPDFDMDDRIAKMRARLSGAAEKRDDRLAARVDQLEAKLDAILEKLDIGDAAPKKPIKKAPPRKVKPASKVKMTTQRTVKKPASKTTASKKSAPKKTVAKKKTAPQSTKKS
jgi:polyhydroxyalkanoate synthesis regulator phasin